MKITRFMGLFGAMMLASMNPESSNDISFRGKNYALNGYNPIYKPKRTKFKGYMRENRRCSFNKNK